MTYLHTSEITEKIIKITNTGIKPRTVSVAINSEIINFDSFFRNRIKL